MAIGIQRKLKKILSISNRDEREEKLRDLARQMGCSLASTYQPVGTENVKHLEEEVIKRIQEAARESRDSSLWLVALISAIASVVSAVAAWIAITKI